MSASNWNRSAAPTAVTQDDSAGANKFGENCLYFPGGTDELVLNADVFNKANAYGEYEFYGTGADWSGARVRLGLLLNGSGNGYFAGYEFGGGNTLKIYKRESGIYTALATTTSISISGSTLYRLSFVVVQDGEGAMNLEAQHILVSTGAVVKSCQVAGDPTFTTAGQAAINVVNDSNKKYWIDHAKFYEAVAA